MSWLIFGCGVVVGGVLVGFLAWLTGPEETKFDDGY